ncbi:hypothetical protein ACOMHN_035323 [Nucella lapillus]
MTNFTGDHLETESNHTVAHDSQALTIIGKVWPPCLLVLGGFGNMATIFVMRRLKSHYSVQHILIMALAVADLFSLSTGTLRRVIYELSAVDVRGVHTVMCKVHLWMTYSSNTISAWLVTCITVQRTMAVLWPHRIRTMCTARAAWMTIAAVAVCAYTFQVHFIVGRKTSEDKRCIALIGVYENFCRYIFPWLNMSVSSLLPYICQVVCDVILSWSLFRASSFSSTAVSTAHNTDSRRKTASSATVMVLALSCAFVLLTLPMRVSQVWYHYRYSHGNEKPKYVPLSVDVLLDVSFMLLYTNSAVNFILYCLTGTRFRREFCSLMCCRASSGGAVSSGKTTYVESSNAARST